MRTEDREWAEEDKKEREIRRLFRLGIKRCCVIAMWEKLAEHAGHVYGAAQPKKLAEIFKVMRNHPNAFACGQMELDSLCLMLTAVNQNYRLLDEPPSVDDRVLCGYLEACHWLEHQSPVPRKRLVGLRSDFLAVCMVVRDEDYGETHEFTKRQWTELAKHVSQELDRELSPDLLRELVEKWREPILEAVDHIGSTYGWDLPSDVP